MVPKLCAPGIPNEQFSDPFIVRRVSKDYFSDVSIMSDALLECPDASILLALQPATAQWCIAHFRMKYQKIQSVLYSGHLNSGAMLENQSVGVWHQPSQTV